MTELIDLLGTSQIQWILTLIAIDVVLGIIAALVKKDFRLGKLGGFMKRGVLTYVFGFAILALAVQALPSLALVGTAAYYLIVLALIGSMLANLTKMGLKLPGYLTK